MIKVYYIFLKYATISEKIFKQKTCVIYARHRSVNILPVSKPGLLCVYVDNLQVLFNIVI